VTSVASREGAVIGALALLIALLAPAVALRPASRSIASARAACRFEPILTTAAARRAASDGATMALDRGNYRVQDYLVYASADPLRAQLHQAGIDAVVAETPFERVRYESFLSRFEGHPISRRELVQLRQATANEIGFIIYAHSRSATPREEEFLRAFRPAWIQLETGARLAAASATRFGPSREFYTVGIEGRDLRWVGSLTVRFHRPRTDVGPCAPAGTLHVVDGYGDRYAFPFDFAKYR
jgi:hypothetical protein